MLISPPIFITLLLLGAAATYLVAARWPRAIYPTTMAVLGSALLLWIVQGQSLAQPVPAEDGANALLFPQWQWQIDETLWLLGGVLLLLPFALILFRMGQPDPNASRRSHFSWQLSRSQWQPVLILALVTAAFSAIWSSNLATLMASWTLLALIWALYLLTTRDENEDVTSVIHRLFWMLAPLLFTGIAAATKPFASDLLQMGSWSPTAITAVLLAVMAQMGIMPFIGWRPQSDQWLPSDGPILYLIPPLVGAGLLHRVLHTGQIAPAIMLLLTLFGLLTLLSGIRRAWVNLRSPSRPPAELALSLSGLAFIAALWAGSEALLAGVQLLVFAVTILFLLEKMPISRARWWRALGPAVAALALIGFPLTAGFITLTSVYTVWLNNALLVLVLALVLLLLPLITAVLIFIHDHYESNPAPNKQKHSVISEVAQLLPAAGLLMLGGIPVAEIHFGTWLALLLTAAGALLLIRFVGEVQELIAAVDAALSTERLPIARYSAAAKKISRQTLFSLGTAAYILEGDRGLLWLAAFLAILLFAVSS